jgi:putative protein kinase ArgK-like GTPase of G3E family
MSRVENREQGWMDAMKQVYPDTGHAKLIGITGSPGADQLTTDMESMLELGEDVDKSNKSLKVTEGVERWPRTVSIR